MASNTKQALLQALSAAEGGYRATRCTPPPVGATG